MSTAAAHGLARHQDEPGQPCAGAPGKHGILHMEFARGGENAITNAMTFLSDDMLKKASLLYIKVPYEESVRKNRKRARPGQEDSILYHSLPDEKMDFYYKTNDWEEIEKKDPHYINIRGNKIPYVVFENMPEKTHDPKLIGEELEKVAKKLWGMKK